MNKNPDMKYEIDFISGFFCIEDNEMDRKKKLTLSITDIFLAAVLMISMLLLVDLEIAGMKLTVFTILVLTLLYVGYWIISMRRGDADIPQLECWGM